MSDDPERKRSMREQVEEYKRKQREAEEQGQDFTREDEAEDDEPEGFVDPEESVKEALSRGPNVGKIVGGIFTLVGLLLLATSGTIFYFTQDSIAAEVETPGVVVRNELRHHQRSSSTSSSSQGSSDLWHAVVEFKVADGTSKTVEMGAGHWPKQWDEGEAVTVRYNPDKPLQARIAGDVAMDYFPSILTGFLGFVFFVVGASVWRFLGRLPISSGRN